MVQQRGDLGLAVTREALQNGYSAKLKEPPLITVIDKDVDGNVVPVGKDAPFSGFVWKVVNDPFIGQLAFVVSPWFLWIMNSGTFFRNADGEPDQIAGAAGLAIVLALVTIGLGVLPAIFLRERMQHVAAADNVGLVDLGKLFGDLAHVVLAPGFELPEQLVGDGLHAYHLAIRQLGRLGHRHAGGDSAGLHAQREHGDDG